MTEWEYIVFLDNQRNQASHHLHTILSDWCEELGWNRERWRDLSRFARRKKLEDLVADFNTKIRLAAYHNAKAMAQLEGQMWRRMGQVP